MAEYTYKDVIIDPEDPRVEIGKEYYSAITSNDVLDFANHNEELAKLIEVDPAIKYPFHIKSDCCDCWTCLLIRKKEPEKRYVPFDLSKEEDREFLRYKWIRCKRNDFESCITAFKYHDTEWKAHVPQQGLRNGEQLLDNYEFMYGSPVGKLVEE